MENPSIILGVTLAVQGDYAVIGAYGNDDDGDASGSAYIFHKDTEGLWDEGTKIIAPDGSAGAAFGLSVGISEQDVIIGAPWDDTEGAVSGAAYIFHRGRERHVGYGNTSPFQWNHSV